DNAGNVLVASSTRSADFPIVNGFDNILNGIQDGIVFKLSPQLDQLLWSTYFGGSSMDAGFALSLDGIGNVFITGGTCSQDLTITAGAYRSSYSGGKADGYIAKIKYDGTELLHSTFLGTTNYDQCFFVQLDDSANVYVFGQTQGVIPVINAAYSNNNGRQFISKLDSTLGSMIMQTKFGNGTLYVNISPSAFLVDCARNIYLSGWGGNILTSIQTLNMPLTPTAHQSTTDGFNFYLMVLSPNAGSLLYATYFGGALSHEHVDGGTSRFDKKGIIYQSVCAGCQTNSSPINHDDFPVTPGAWPTSLYGNNWNQSTNCNNGTFKFNFEYAIPVARITSSGLSGCTPLTVNFANTSISAAQYLWDFGNNDTTSMIMHPSRTFSAPGTYTVNLLAKNNACYNVWDTAVVYVTVHPKPSVSFVPSTVACTDTFNFNNTSTIPGGTMSYAWNFGDGATSTLEDTMHVYTTLGTYTTSLIATSDKGCKDSLKIPVVTNIHPDSVGLGTAYCPERIQPYQLYAHGGGTYQWSPASGLTGTTISNPIASPSTTTTYSVAITETDWSGNTCQSIDTVRVEVYPSVNANFNMTVNSCGNTAQVSDLSTAAPTYWGWYFGDGDSSHIQNPVHSYAIPGTYSITLAVANAYGCVDTIVKPLSIGGFDPLSISASQPICTGNSAQLSASGGVSYVWSPAATLSNANIANPVATPTATTIYTVTITAVNSMGLTCVSNLSTAVLIPTPSSLQLSATANPDTIAPGEVSYINTNIGSPYTIQWTPPYALSSASAYDPTATPGHTTTYQAIATSNIGCKFVLDSVTIYVITNLCNEGSVFVPNTFSPNADGTNDVLYVRSNFVTELYFAVYNRWGEMVFETTDIKKGWDGIYKGMKSDPGVFGYYLKYKCNNGEESFRKGNVTLIR
ncbi:MAG TPA: PKD domain-containing protein, partial [Bacteroidia bacterium]